LSLRVTSIVWEYFEGGGSLLLTALALADYCGDDQGTRIFPSIDELAKKTRQDRRTVQRQLRKLQRDGWLQPWDDKPCGRGQVKRYRIASTFMDKMPPFLEIKGGAGAQKGGNSRSHIEEQKELKTLKGKSSSYSCDRCGGAGVVSDGPRWYCRAHDPKRTISGPSPT
jgi:hypothetical protein